MFRRFGITTLALAAALAVAAPASTFARERGGNEHGDRGRSFERRDFERGREGRDFRGYDRDRGRFNFGVGVYAAPAPAANGYYDQFGVWHPYGYYDQFGVWQPYAY